MFIRLGRPVRDSGTTYPAQPTVIIVPTNQATYRVIRNIFRDPYALR